MNDEICYRNPVKALGFAAIYHVLTLDMSLSDGAYRLYGLLVYYAGQSGRCWPGVETLARQLGKHRDAVSEYLHELEGHALIIRERRFGQSTITWLEDVDADQAYTKRAEYELLQRDERRKNPTTDVGNSRPQSSEKPDVEEEPEKDNQDGEPEPPARPAALPTPVAGPAAAPAGEPVTGAEPLVAGTDHLPTGDERPVSDPTSVRADLIAAAIERDRIIDAALAGTHTRREDVDPDGNENPRQTGGSAHPDNPAQVAFLAVCHAKWFKAKQKNRVKGILNALDGGEAAGDKVYRNCLAWLDGRATCDGIPLMPRSWYDWNTELARTRGWSVQGLIDALLNHDNLAQHCARQIGKEVTHGPKEPGRRAPGGDPAPVQNFDVANQAALTKLLGD